MDVGVLALPRTGDIEHLDVLRPPSTSSSRLVAVCHRMRVARSRWSIGLRSFAAHRHRPLRAAGHVAVAEHHGAVGVADVVFRSERRIRRIRLLHVQIAIGHPAIFGPSASGYPSAGLDAPNSLAVSRAARSTPVCPPETIRLIIDPVPSRGSSGHRSCLVDVPGDDLMCLNADGMVLESMHVIGRAPCEPH